MKMYGKMFGAVRHDNEKNSVEICKIIFSEILHSYVSSTTSLFRVHCKLGQCAECYFIINDDKNLFS